MVLRRAGRQRSERLHGGGSPSAPVSCRELVKLDSSRVREAYVGLWKSAEKAFARQREILERHRNRELPAYENWLRRNFASEMSDLKAVNAQISRQQWIVERVQFVSARKGISCESLWEYLSDLPGRGLSMEEKLSEAYEELREEDRGGPSRANSSGERKRGPRNKQNDRRLEKSRELKKLYRELCRQLHPDTGCDFDARTKRLWEQVQIAYEKGDVDMLRSLKEGLFLDLTPENPSLLCSDIVDRIAELESGVQSLRQLIQKSIHTPAWGFLKWSAHDRYAAKRHHKQEIKTLLDEEMSQLQQLDEIVKSWEGRVGNR